MRIVLLLHCHNSGTISGRSYMTNQLPFLTVIDMFDDAYSRSINVPEVNFEGLLLACGPCISTAKVIRRNGWLLALVYSGHECSRRSIAGILLFRSFPKIRPNLRRLLSSGNSSLKSCRGGSVPPIFRSILLYYAPFPRRMDPKVNRRRPATARNENFKTFKLFRCEVR